METTSFVLGMLSIIAAAIIAVVVWGIVKINKLTFELKATHEWIDNGTRDRDYNLQQVYKKFEETDRQTSYELERVYNQIAECRSYTDSRIDKATPNKQLIKG
jgi:biopolymer transport protein ExbB/TolQ